MAPVACGWCGCWRRCSDRWTERSVSEFLLRYGAHVSTAADVAADVMLAPGAVIWEGVRIGSGCAVGAGAVIHPGTEVGAECVVEDGAVLGKRPRLRPGSSAAGEVGPLVVGDGATVCCGAVLYA